MIYFEADENEIIFEKIVKKKNLMFLGHKYLSLRYGKLLLN
jgi:hypothetical protein